MSSERLSDEDINSAVDLGCAATLEDVFNGEDILAMATEIRERRASDLTPDEIVVLQAWRSEGRTVGTVDLGLVAVAAIEKILAAHRAKP